MYPYFLERNLCLLVYNSVYIFHDRERIQQPNTHIPMAPIVIVIPPYVTLSKSSAEVQLFWIVLSNLYLKHLKRIVQGIQFGN